VPFGLYSVYKELTHHEHAHGPTFSHMRIRRKAYPWAAGDCTLFDLECKAAHSSGAAPAHH